MVHRVLEHHLEFAHLMIFKTNSYDNCYYWHTTTWHFQMYLAVK